MATFKQVLVIDDDELFLFVSKAIMQDEGFAEHIREYEDATDALAYLKSAKTDELPDLLFLDINMPMMDGWEFLDAVDQLGLPKKMAVYITSSSINPLDLKNAEINPYVRGFMSKPLDPQKLKKLADELK
jgi:CheY-like chemotaxis protein